MNSKKYIDMIFVILLVSFYSIKAMDDGFLVTSEGVRDLDHTQTIVLRAIRMIAKKQLNPNRIWIVNLTGTRKFRPLCAAAILDDTASIRRLVELGCDLDGADPDGKTALQHAHERGCLAAIQELQFHIGRKQSNHS